MARIFNYYVPLDIGSAFPSKNDVGEFIEYMVGRLQELVLENERDDYIPPVVYSQKGRVFNFDYNFMINCLDDFLDNVGVKDDFFLTESPSPVVMKNAYFLVANIFDEYYDIVRIKMKSFDHTKARSSRPIEFKNNFYNPLIIGNGSNVKRFSAVPFSASELKKLLSDNTFVMIDSLTNKDVFQQVAFGVKGCMEFVRNNNIEPLFVTN